MADLEHITVNGETYDIADPTARDSADEAANAASSAQSAADKAQSSADSAQSSADSANTAASNAQSTADSANTAASNAQSTADSANTAAGNAQSTADSASTAAANAQSSADKAQSTADANAEDISDIKEAIDDMFSDCAGVHNGIFRGKYLGDHVTDEQWAAIKAGTFDDLYIGDYWTIDGVNWRIAAFDYYINTGSTYACTDHHIVIVPDERLYTAQMNTSNTTTGGYVGSAMFTTNLADAKTAVNNAFGSGHILKHEVYRTNAVTSGYPSAGEWLDITVDLMNEEMVYGCPIKQQMSYGGTSVYTYTCEKSQLPLFQYRHDLIGIRATWWLADIVTAASFAYVGSGGRASSTAASIANGVRPAFCIYAS